MLNPWRRPLVAIAVAALFLTGCVVYPRNIEYYDGDCDIVAKKMILESSAGSGAVVNCSNRECLAVVLGVTAASLIVAGSIVIVGNTVHWLEKQGRCISKSRD